MAQFAAVVVIGVADATAAGVVVCNTPIAPMVSTAEHTLALMFAAAALDGGPRWWRLEAPRTRIAAGVTIARIEKMLTKRGSVILDDRTNTLIITDLSNNLIVIDDLIMAHGGFGTSGQTKQGFAVIDATGDADPLTALVRIKTTTGVPGQPSIVPKYG